MEQSASREAKSTAKAPADSSAVETATNPHRSAMICSIIGGILLVALAAVAVWFFGFYSQPQKVVSDATKQVLQSDQLLVDGEIALSSPDASELPFEKITVKFVSNFALPQVTNATVGIQLPQQDVLASFDITAITTTDAIFLKVSDLIAALKQAGVDPAELEETGAFAVLEIVDNDWWEISLDNFSGAQNVAEVYSCLKDVAATADFTEAYDQNTFLQATRVAAAPRANWHRVYQIAVDHDKLDNFADTAAMDQLLSCYGYVENEDSPLDGSEADLDATFSQFSDVQLFFEVSLFEHRLDNLHGTFKHGELEGAFDFNFFYDGEVKVTQPASYRPITDLFEELSEAMEVEGWAY